MVILDGRPFRVAAHHRRMVPEDGDSDLSQGLVLQVSLEFEDWLDGQPLIADAFLDPGADSSMISRRWIAEQSKKEESSSRTPWADPDGRLLEQVHLSIEGWRVPLGDPERPIWLFDQDYGPEQTGSMPGYEDLLLGRDFLSQHGLLVVIDGESRSFSVLVVDDAENRLRRDRILNALRTK